MKKSFKRSVTLVLTGTVLVLTGVAVGGTSGDESSEPVRRDPIVGTWNCTVPADTSPCIAPDCFNVIKNFHAGGTMVEMDNLNPPSQESIVLGDWTRTGNPEKRTYSAELEQFDFTGGTFHGTFHYFTPLKMDRSLNKLSGSFHATEVDSFGNITDLGTGSVSCTRNTAL